MDKNTKHLYVVKLDVEPEYAEQFNKWYNTVHIPALLKVPGVLGASRFTTKEGTPKYMAVYEFDRPNVTTSDAWKKAIEMTPRPKEIVTKNASRNLYERIY